MQIKNFIALVASVVLTYGFTLDVVIWNIKEEDRYVAVCWAFIAMIATIITGVVAMCVYEDKK